jgi:hypothetical protein
MNTLELKGNLIELVSNVQNQEILEKLMHLFKKTVREEEADWWDELTPEQQAELELSIAECDDPAKLTSHEKVMQMTEEWLNE